MAGSIVRGAYNYDKDGTGYDEYRFRTDADLVLVKDTGNKFTATQVEGVLSEIQGNLTTHTGSSSVHVTKDGTLQTGLNADKLDGLDAVNLAVQKIITSTQLQDTRLQSGFYNNSGDGILNSDGSIFKTGYWHVLVSYHGIDGYAMQIATPLADDSQSRYYRTSYTTNWNPWRKILDQRDYDTLFQYANDGKTQVANAVTAKGVTASSSDTFSTLATKIGQIPTGRKYASGSATVIAYQYLTVTGLTFSPSYVLIWSENTYIAKYTMTLNKYNTIPNNKVNYTAHTDNIIQSSLTDSVFNADGFSAMMWGGGSTYIYNWIAFE